MEVTTIPYVNVPNDLSKIKTKIAFNLTKRQLICFSGGALVGIPVYLVSRSAVGNSAALFLMAAVVDYAKLRPVFEGYKATKYSRKYLSEHSAELSDFRAAQAAIREILNGEKLPPMGELKEKRRRLAADKKRLYTEYRQAQSDMREAVAVKANIDHLLGNTADVRNKEQER